MESGPVPTPLQSPAADFWGAVEDLTTLEGRLVASALVVFAALVAVRFVLPAVIRFTAAFVERRMPEGRVRSLGESFSHYVPTTLGTLSLRLLQFGVLLAATAVLLAVWERVGEVGDLLQTAGITTGRLTQILLTIGLLFVAYLATRVLREVVEQYSDGADQITDHQQEIIVRVGNVALVTLALTTALTLWGLNLSGLLVGAGFLGIVVGMAARQTLGSLIAGFVLMLSRPFTIGDWVAIGGHEGIVTNITIMNTRMKNFDGEVIVIPNDRVSNEPITNRSAQGHLRLRVDVGVDYESDPEHAERVATEAISGAQPVSGSPPPQVIPKSFGDSAVVLELRFWIDRPTPARKWRAVSAVVSSVKSTFEAEGIKIPFPQRELSGRAETGGFQVHDGMGETDTRGEVEPSPED